MHEFLIRALLGGIGVAIIAGPLGCFIVWRRMAFFGDSIAHSALLGVALGFAIGIDLEIGVIATALVFAVLLALLERRRWLASDTLLAILSYSGLAVGLTAISLMPTLRVDLLAYLFGDLLAVGRIDLIWIFGGGSLTLAALIALWRPLLAITIHEELAAAEGVPVERIKLAAMILIALTVGIAMKIVGILLITALMILPAATARRFATTPERMAILAAALGSAAVALGLGLSLGWDIPAGPAIVVASAALFALSAIFGRSARLA